MRQLDVHPAANLTCEKHGNRGSLPCAWPDCVNGIAEDEFQERPIFVDANNTKPPVVYLRREWSSPLGGNYYSWDSSNLPNWFFVPQIFWNEARRHRLVPDSFATLLYHYTSLEGFFGIVESGSIWLTDFSYLNDRRELTYGAERALQAIQRMAEHENNVQVRDLLATWAENLRTLQNRVCISSFSADGDSLSQWRAYGPIAVGFETDSLALHVDQGRLQPVEYRPETQDKLIDIYLHHLKSAYSLDVSSGRLDRIPDVYHKVERLLEVIAFFKDPAFSSENEYRLVYIDNPEVLESLGLEKPPKSFRISKGRIVPFVASTEVLPSEFRNYELKIAEVVIGPESDELLERGVREYMHAKGIGGVTVRRSTVPLRP